MPVPQVKRRESLGVPTPALPIDQEVAYSVGAWDEECFALFAEGRDPGTCPSCRRTAFYGPRVGGRGRRYRACRFCGLLQDVGGRPGRATPTVHGCADWPEVARAPYIWWLPPEQTEYTCPYCEEQVSADDARVTAPIDDRDHPWWKIPQGRTRFYYSRFWENWPCTKSRTFL